MSTRSPLRALLALIGIHTLVPADPGPRPSPELPPVVLSWWLEPREVVNVSILKGRHP
jgi:hypothetical protein